VAELSFIFCNISYVYQTAVLWEFKCLETLLPSRPVGVNS